MPVLTTKKNTNSCFKVQESYCSEDLHLEVLLNCELLLPIQKILSSSYWQTLFHIFGVIQDFSG